MLTPALRHLIASLPAVGSPRVEAMRLGLQAYASALGALVSTPALSHIAGDGGGDRFVAPASGERGRHACPP